MTHIGKEIDRVIAVPEKIKVPSKIPVREKVPVPAGAPKKDERGGTGATRR